MTVTSTMHIEVKKATQSRLAELNTENLGFGKIFSDHIFVSNYKNEKWENPRIIPFANFEVSPCMSALHYGQSIFEGMKAYRYSNGDIYMFRPLENFKRFNQSAERMAMPSVPEDIFMEGLVQLLRLDKNWVPDGESCSLYIRPVAFATEAHIGVKISDTYDFMIITSPVGAYYSQPIKVLVEIHFTRAVPGGVGFAKTSGNYGRSHLPTKLAKEKGYDQIIWTDGYSHKYLEESGTMNLMCVIDNTLITPELHDTILNGVTRKSVLTLAREDLGIKTEERKVSVDELVNAHNKGTLEEMFGVGTAATIAPISLFGYNDKNYKLPPASEHSIGSRIKKELNNIRRGKIADKHNWMYKV
ncbi:MAG: branched-chain amino acid aminotransferase [Bacteroidetes bacterium]|nr:branched-chain amino acid aminotransferase [Bacteroidota bacterium]